MNKSRYTSNYRRVLQLLRRLRKECDLRQTDVARKLGVYASFVSKCESGDRRIDVVELAEFCRVYGITLNDFLKQADIK